MANHLSVNVGDRIKLRQRAWRIRGRRSLPPHIVIFELESLDTEKPRSISVVVPPDEFFVLPTESLYFDVKGLNAFASWANDHRLIAATLMRETAVLSGARFGRVCLEAYQLAPTLRLLNKPRPSLLIADDVGLGKTIEAGLALLELAARGRARRVLVVTPPGLLLQWKDELEEKFGMQFTLIENAAGLARVQTQLPAGISPWEALPRVLTSIDFLKKETVRDRALRKQWDLIIVDEVHGLAEAGTPANPYRTQRTRLGLALRDSAKGLILLSATPHNGYPHSFRSLINLVEPTAATFHGKPETIARRVQRAMIRRMKPQIVHKLPNGTEEPVFPRRDVQGIPVEVKGAERELLKKVAAYCSRTARSAKEAENAEQVTFAMQIIKKRSLSSRNALGKTIENRLNALRKKDEEEVPPTNAEIRDLQADLPLDEATAERTAIRIIKSALPKEEKQRKAEIRALNDIRKTLRSLPERDPKIDVLLREIRAVFGRNPNDKIIVFTEYLDTLEAIREALEKSQDLAGRFVILRGGLSGRQRARVQEKFEEIETRLLLATDAASEGLNLQRSCHRVFHFELPWNPNRMEQRNGRVDRYGQTQTPVIRYLYYPDSPEDDVLHRLVGKIERMQDDRVSTPDILGTLQGTAELDQGLVYFDPEAGDIDARKESLVRLFDDRTADFVRNVYPLVAAGGPDESENRKLLDLLNTAHPLLPDDEELERIVADLIGPSSFKPTDQKHIFRVQVPIRYRGPDVKAIYPRVTFRRSIAVKYRAADVEFITPLHPLVQTMAAEARRHLLQVYPDERSLPPRRLAARRVPDSEAASVVFTYFGSITGGGSLLEEHLMAIRVTPDLQVIGSSGEALRWLQLEANAGEVPADLLERLFKTQFDAMMQKALKSAQLDLKEHVVAVKEHRRRQAEILRHDLERDLADRLQEIENEERQAKGLVEAGGQLRLFSFEEVKTTGFESKRAVAKAQAEKRRGEIAQFEQVDDPDEPRPLGALFLVPEECL